MPAEVTAELLGRLIRVTLTRPSGSFSTTDPSANAIVIEGANGPGEIGLRVSLRVDKTNQKEPNKGELTIYNLAPATRAALQVKGWRALVEAGYKGTGLATAAVLDIRTVDHVRDKADWKTELKGGDGERAFAFAWASKSFAKGTTVGEVLRYCASSLGLSMGNADAQAAKLSQALYGSWTVHGTASAELDRICKAVGLMASVQDGVIQVLAPTESVAQSVPLLTPDTGLIGSPEMGSPAEAKKQASLKFKSLFLPQLRPGGRVRIKSARYDGIFRLLKVQHSLDTHGDDWYSDCESIADGTVRAA